MKNPGPVLTREEASAVAAKFAIHRGSVQDGRALAPHADTHAIEAIVRAAFWASLRREEGRTPKISLAFLPPDASQPTLRFERPLPLSPGALTRLGPAVERPGIHLAIWREDQEYSVWGIAGRLPDLCFVLEVFEPGLLAIKYSRSRAFGKFGTIAVLEGEQTKIVNEAITDRPDCPVLLSSLVGFDPHVDWLDEANLLVRLAASMRAHGHGGLLLIVPTADERWRDSIARPARYAAVPPFTRLAELTRRTRAGDRGSGWREELRHAIDGVAGLTAVDGATVMNRQHDVLAFGAMISRSDESRSIETLLLTEPIEGNVTSIVDPAQIGHSRHLSAAQFVHDQHDALALVASQDGRFTTLTWSDTRRMVHAYRIDALLM